GARALDSQGEIVEFKRRVAELELAAGDLVEAERQAVATLVEAERLSLRAERVHLHRVLALAAARRKQPSRASREILAAEALLAASDTGDASRVELARAEVELANDRLDEAQRHAEAARAAFDRQQAFALAEEAQALGARVARVIARRAAASGAAGQGDLLARAVDELAQPLEEVRAAEIALDLALAASGAERGIVYVAPTPLHDELRVTLLTDSGAHWAGRVDRYSHTLAQRVFTKDESVCLHNVDADDAIASAASIVDMRLRSVMAVPLRFDGQPRGLLYLDSRHLVGPGFAESLPTVERIAKLLTGALERARLQLLLKSQQETMSILAHEMRSPMTAILGFAELASLRLPDHAAHVDELINVASKEGQRMVRLINDALQLGRAWRFSLHEEAVAPGKLLLRAAETASPKARKLDVAVACVVEEGVRDVLVDAERVQQVLGNIIENALRYSPSATTITLRARPEPFQGVVGERHAVRFEVEDQGPGVSATDAAAIFTKFSRGSAPRGEGSGLGLNIAQAIVQAHGGRIWVESPAGARFCFTLPVAAEPS
ncbi:MAG: GAF domain-containing sensor histidine kinase, partial [Myxococcales bacterium]|nr:GAF domain-containing sensor histidine kinase [Myxococcales bacterium]